MASASVAVKLTLDEMDLILEVINDSLEFCAMAIKEPSTDSRVKAECRAKKAKLDDLVLTLRS